MTCDNSDPQEIDMLFASEILDRVYPQTNVYYSECVGEGNHFILGLAVAKGDDHRLKAKGEFDYASIDLEWVDTPYWRLHPHWRYCLLNDTDSHITKEEAFTVYVHQMRDQKSLPPLCIPRRRLVDRILLDLKATSELTKKWEANNKYMIKNEVTVVFFTSPSGMIRFYNISLDDFSYEDTAYDKFNIAADTPPIENYQHYITDTNRKSVDDRYYRRAIRNNGAIVFDVNYFAKLWYKEEKETPYGISENVTMLASASQTVYMGKAIIGVAGIEVGYDALIRIFGEHGCAIGDERRWCVLLDEHAYVLYSNQKGVVKYEDFYEPQGAHHLGKWFGSINRVAQRAMGLLVAKHFYTRYNYLDHQATCKAQVTPPTTSAAALKPMLLTGLRLVLSSIARLLRSLGQSFPILSILQQAALPIEAYTASFHDAEGSFACTKSSPFYFANREGRHRPKGSLLVENNRSERPCQHNKCSVKMSASFIEGTNLIMVWIIQDASSSSCYEDNQCTMQQPSEVPFGFIKSSNSTRAGLEETSVDKCKGPKSRRTLSKKACYVNDATVERGLPCSGLAGLSLAFPLLVILLRLLIR